MLLSLIGRVLRTYWAHICLWGAVIGVDLDPSVDLGMAAVLVLSSFLSLSLSFSKLIVTSSLDGSMDSEVLLVSVYIYRHQPMQLFFVTLLF